MLENAAESHTSGARFVGTLLTFRNLFEIHYALYSGTFSNTAG